MNNHNKWTCGDSNPGPTGYEPVALTNWATGPHMKADERTRTVNLLITNQLLCQLSHIGMSLLSCFLFLFLLSLMTPRGFEPLLPPWKGGVLTAWPWSLVSCFCPCSFLPVFSFLFPVLCTCFLMQKSSPSRARTYNPSVNSRVLYHWAIEDYFHQILSELWMHCTFKTTHWKISHPEITPLSFLHG